MKCFITRQDWIKPRLVDSQFNFQIETSTPWRYGQGDRKKKKEKEEHLIKRFIQSRDII